MQTETETTSTTAPIPTMTSSETTMTELSSETTIQISIGKRKAITYFYKEGSGYRMEARYPGSRVSYSKDCDSKEAAISHEFSVRQNPEKFL